MGVSRFHPEGVTLPTLSLAMVSRGGPWNAPNTPYPLAPEALAAVPLSQHDTNVRVATHCPGGDWPDDCPAVWL